MLASSEKLFFNRRITTVQLEAQTPDEIIQLYYIPIIRTPYSRDHISSSGPSSDSARAGSGEYRGGDGSGKCVGYLLLCDRHC